MSIRTIAFVSIVAVCFTVTTTSADWDPSQPAKWVQLPDLSPEGMDINATYDPVAGGLNSLIVLADDFLCTSTDPITDIHLWGSWIQDVLPQVFDPDEPTFYRPDPGSVQFHLSIRADIPADTGPLPTPYSRPGELLWSKVFNPGEFLARPYAQNIEEGWYDPLSGQYVFPGDTVAWQYNFLIPEDEAFIQQGDAANPVIYWLDVAAIPQNAGPTPVEPLFGWKSSVDHWNDVAVYGAVDLSNWPNPQEWLPLDNIPTGIAQRDLAFVITPEPASLVLLSLGLLAVARRR